MKYTENMFAKMFQKIGLKLLKKKQERENLKKKKL